MNEQSEHELAQAIRELRETVSGLQETVSGLQEAVNRNTAAIDRLIGRVDGLDSRMVKQEQATVKLTDTMERVHVRLASKLDASEMAGFVEATNTRLVRLEREAGLEHETAAA